MAPAGSGPSRSNPSALALEGPKRHPSLIVRVPGHNGAIVGLVDLTSEGWSLPGLMFGLTIFLGATYAVIYAVLHRIGRVLRS